MIVATTGSGSSSPLSEDSILVVRMSSVGDIVLTEPVIAALRSAYPSARIGFVVKRKYVDLVASNPAVDTVHSLEDSSLSALRRLCREVRAEDYSAVVDLHRNTRSLILTVCSRAPLATAYRKREFKDSLRVRFGRRSFRVSRMLVERYLDALAPLGLRPEYRKPLFHLSPADIEWAGRHLDGLGLVPGAYAVVVPGALWPTKRWPPERFAAVSRTLVAEFDLRVLLLGSPSERRLCDEIAGDAGAGVLVAAGETELGQMAAIIDSARVFVGNDSGPMHIAAALGTPTVAIFGPTDPGQFDFENHEVVYADLECSACSFYGTDTCKLDHWECMQSLSSELVLAAARRLLKTTDGGS